jgi:hypothetical protein
MQPNYKTIGVVIWLSRLSGVVAARFHYNVVAFSNKAMANGLDSAINPRPQLTKQTVKDILFASYFPDHLLLPVTVQQKSSAMLSTSGRELPWASSSKMLCTICLFSTALINPLISETGKHKER